MRSLNEIHIQSYDSPLGELLIGSFKNQLCLCDWQQRQKRASIDRRLQTGLNAHYVNKKTAIIDTTFKQLNRYFRQELTQFDLPILMVGTDFQQRVWRSLQTIPYASTTSYQTIASTIHNKTAVRAVANAIGANAVSLIIPCHRIIGSHGSLTGYAGGLAAKKQLLALEQNQ